MSRIIKIRKGMSQIGRRGTSLELCARTQTEQVCFLFLLYIWIQKPSAMLIFWQHEMLLFQCQKKFLSNVYLFADIGIPSRSHAFSVYVQCSVGPLKLTTVHRKFRKYPSTFEPFLKPLCTYNLRASQLLTNATSETR